MPPALLLALWVDRLIEIDPEHAGKESDGGRERQEEHDGPDGIFRDPPAGHSPEQRGEDRDNHEPETVTDVHCSEEVAGFALELQIADGTTLVHFRKSAKD